MKLCGEALNQGRMNRERKHSKERKGGLGKKVDKKAEQKRVSSGRGKTEPTTAGIDMSFQQPRSPLQVILDATPHGIVVLEGEEGLISYINSRALELCGADLRGLEMKTYSAAVTKFLRMEGEVYKPEDLPAPRALLHGERVRGEEMIIERPDGSRIAVAAHAAPTRDEEGNITGSVGIFEDITTQKELEKLRSAHSDRIEELLHERTRELMRSQINFGHLFNSMPDGAVVVDTRGIVRFANPAALGLFNAVEGEFIGSQFGMPVVEGSAEIAVMQEGRTLTIELSSTEVYWEDEQAHLVILRDVTTRKRALERVRTLSRRLIDAQERERRYIGHELHDEVGGSLTALKLALDRARHALRGQEKAMLNEANELLDYTLDYVRTLSHSMRPGVLDDFGLEKALRWYVNRYTSQTGIKVNLACQRCAGRYPEDVETAIYRIVQESLTNTAKYSRASQAKVECRYKDGTLGLVIEDDGCGFDASVISQESMGISGMYDRAFLLGGTLTVDSSPGKGTRITCELPVKSA